MHEVWAIAGDPWPALQTGVQTALGKEVRAPVRFKRLSAEHWGGLRGNTQEAKECKRLVFCTDPCQLSPAFSPNPQGWWAGAFVWFYIRRILKSLH